MKCPYCNAEIEDGSKFCTNCGKSLADSDLEGLGDEPPRKSMEKAMRILVIGASVIATVIIAITLGVRSFISREYQKGVSAYENQDYESAVTALKHAVRWGHNEQAQALLAHSYYRLGKLDEAYAAYETVYATMSDDEEVAAGYADTCEKLAYRCISENNAEQAVVYLKKEYELTEDERVSRRIKAIEGGGNFADEHGKDSLKPRSAMTKAVRNCIMPNWSMGRTGSGSSPRHPFRAPQRKPCSEPLTGMRQESLSFPFIRRAMSSAGSAKSANTTATAA